MKTCFLRVLRYGILFTVTITAVSAFPSEDPPSRPGVCLVLSGGGARGLAHIGVLQYLDERGLRPACIVGTSAGALVGSLYAAGYSAGEIERLFRQIDFPALVREEPERRRLAYSEKQDTPVSGLTMEIRDGSLQLPAGLISGHHIQKELDRAFAARGVLHQHDFDALPVPFRAVATDLRSGEEYIFREGNLTTAVRASISIPFVFTPVEYEKMTLVDGGVLNNVAVDAARRLGYRTVVAVNLSTPLPAARKKLSNSLQILDEAFTLVRLEKDRQQLAMADLVLQPAVAEFTLIDFDKLDELMTLGYASAREAGDRLAELFRDAPLTPPPPAVPGWLYDRPVAKVSVEGNRMVPDTEVLQQSEISPGKTLTSEGLERSVENIYALRWFGSVRYEVDQPAAPAVRFVVEEKPHRLLELGLHYDNQYQFTGIARYRSRRLLNTNLESDVILAAGNLKNFQAGLRFPFRSRLPASLKAEVYFTQIPRNVIFDEKLIETFKANAFGFRASGFLNLGRLAGLEGSLTLENLNIVSLGWFDEEGREWSGKARLALGVDTADDWFFPQRGFRLRGELEKVFPLFGGNLDYTRSRFEGDLFMPVRGHHVLHLSGTSCWGWNVPPYLIYFAGGHETPAGVTIPVPGYQPGELYGQDLWNGLLEYRIKFPFRAIGLADASYLYFQYGITGARLPDTGGGVIQLQTPYQIFHGGGVGYALSSRFGPMHFFAGLGESGRFAWTVSLGARF